MKETLMNFACISALAAAIFVATYSYLRQQFTSHLLCVEKKEVFRDLMLDSKTIDYVSALAGIAIGVCLTLLIVSRLL